MKLDRNMDLNGKGKYALVRLRDIKSGSGKRAQLLYELANLGVVDFGLPGSPDEFFVLKLRDVYAHDALRGYLRAIARDLSHMIFTEEEAASLREYADEIRGLLDRAGLNSKFAKRPD